MQAALTSLLSSLVPYSVPTAAEIAEDVKAFEKTHVLAIVGNPAPFFILKDSLIVSVVAIPDGEIINPDMPDAKFSVAVFRSPKDAPGVISSNTVASPLIDLIDAHTREAAIDHARKFAEIWLADGGKEWTPEELVRASHAYEERQYTEMQKKLKGSFAAQTPAQPPVQG